MTRICLPVPARTTPGPGGTLLVETRPMCWGTDYPAPDLPELDITDPESDLPDDALPEADPDVVKPGDEAVTGSKSEAKSEEDVTEEACTQACDACSAAQQGAAKWRQYEQEDAEVQEENTWQGYRYQAYICGLPHEPVKGRIMEWFFVAYYWDGFEAATCRMIETKYGYNTLLEHYYRDSLGPESALYSVRPKADVKGWAYAQFARIVAQAAKQKARLTPYPEVGLIWYFSHFDSWVFFRMTGGATLMIDTDYKTIDPA